MNKIILLLYKNLTTNNKRLKINFQDKKMNNKR